MIWETDGGRVMAVHNPAILLGYSSALRRACEDFVKRAEMIDEASADDIMELVTKAPGEPGYELLLALDSRYRLLGFSVCVAIGRLAGGGVELEVPVTYMRPDRPAPAVSRMMRDVIDIVGRGYGAKRVSMISNRRRDKAWSRYGYHPVGVIYTREIPSEDN